MRLGQLARKLELTPKEIIDFLTEKSIATEKGSNTKLNIDQEALVIDRFGPIPDTETTEVVEEASKETIDVDVVTNEDIGTVETNSGLEPEASNQVIDIVENDSIITPSTDDDNISSPDESTVDEDTVNEGEVSIEVDKSNTLDTESNDDEEDEDYRLNIDYGNVIRAPKVSLQGLKVVGKVDLPKSKSKEEDVSEPSNEINEPESSKDPQSPSNTIQETNTKVSTKPDKRNKSRKSSNRSQGKSDIERARIREEREAEKQKRIEAREKKKRRTQNYQEKIKSSQAKVVKKKSKKNKVTQTVIVEQEQPKGWFARFWKWYTT